MHCFDLLHVLIYILYEVFLFIKQTQQPREDYDFYSPTSYIL